ncbi:hypothetical protein C0J45_19959 [Silurus meridionalis]|nr:hypothetical protein C0J45_19959 [Silurus meridionalis]
METKSSGSKARNIGGGFKLFYHGVDGKRNGVGVILKEEYSKSVVEVKRVSDRVMIMKGEVEGMMLNVISAYAPKVGCEMEKKEFWSELDQVVDGVPWKERLVIGADFNGYAGEGNRGDEEVMGRMVVEVKKKRRRVRTERRIRWWKLKEEECRVRFREEDYDRVPREELWYCMRKSGVSEKYVRVVQDMYEDSVTAVKCAVGITDWFKVKVGLHQGSG